MKPHKYPSYSDAEWSALAVSAKKQPVLAGFYNLNYRLDVAGVPLLFRFPTNAPLMDPRPMAEVAVMKLISHHNLPVPELAYAAPDGGFHVQEFIEGALVEKAHPPGSKMPDDILKGIADFYGRMAALDVNPASLLPPDWPRQGPMSAFFEKMLETTRGVYATHRASHGLQYDSINMPADPFASFVARAVQLSLRPWKLIHCDLHRGNMIATSEGPCMIDWELAVYGDLLYCIAVHLHRTRYFADEKAALAQNIRRALPDAFQQNFVEDLGFYLDYEALKSVIVDTARFPALISKPGMPRAQSYELCVYFSDNLARIAPMLGIKSMKPEEAMDWFRLWTV